MFDRAYLGASAVRQASGKGKVPNILPGSLDVRLLPPFSAVNKNQPGPGCSRSYAHARAASRVKSAPGEISLGGDGSLRQFLIHGLPGRRNSRSRASPSGFTGSPL